MWFWTSKMMQEASALGAPLDVVEQVRSAQSSARICSFIHIAIVVGVFLLVFFFIILGLLASQ